MKFENIKENDIVFIRKHVSYGFKRSNLFYVPVKIIKVTNTQFTVETGERFKRENGCIIGKGVFCFAYELGEKKQYEKGLVADESKEFLAFKQKVNFINSITTKFDKLERNSETLIETDFELIVQLNSILTKIMNKPNE